MTFDIHYRNGVKRIKASSFKEAEEIANKKYKTWVDIYKIKRGEE